MRGVIGLFRELVQKIVDRLSYTTMFDAVQVDAVPRVCAWKERLVPVQRQSGVRRGATMPVLIVTMLMACLLPLFTAQSGATRDLTTPETPVVDDDVARRIRIFREVLLSSSDSTSLTSRRDAAVELLAIEAREAEAVIHEALASNDEDTQLAVIEAMAMATTADPSYIDDLTAILPTVPARIVTPLRLVIARYGDAGVRRLAELSSDQSLEIEVRRRAIGALGAIRRQSAAIQLVELLHADRREPGPIIDAACDALSHLTGRPFGREPGQWLRWWEDAHDLPDAAWNAILLSSLTDQVADLERKLRTERRRTERAVSRQLDSLNDLFPLLSIDDQRVRLPELLRSEHETERLFALERVGRLLRDSIPIPESLQTSIIERLTDNSPTVRRRAIALLDELDHPDLANAVTAMLAREDEDSVILDALRLLRKRPTAYAMDEVIRQLADPSIAPVAATTLTAILDRHRLQDHQQRILIEALAPMFAETRDPAFALLLAWLGDQATADGLESFLDDEDVDLRNAVADGFVRRGFRRPLLDRAEVEAMYPYAVRVIANAPPSLGELETLLRLPPPHGQERVWTDGIRKLVRGLPLTEVVATDDLLMSFGYVPLELRRDILHRALSGETAGPQGDARDETLDRLLQVLLAMDQPDEAYRRLEELRTETSPQFLTLRFRAALATARFDEASEINDSPLAWIRQLERLVESNIDRAIALRDEIIRRYGGQLSPDDQAVFDAVAEQLSSDVDAEASASQAAADAGHP